MLLAKVQQEHPEDDEVARMIATVRSDQAEQRKLQVLTYRPESAGATPIQGMH